MLLQRRPFLGSKEASVVVVVLFLLITPLQALKRKFCFSDQMFRVFLSGES